MHLPANSARFCVLPTGHRPNLPSRTLALCERRLGGDWLEVFGHPIPVLETYVGDTRGYRRRQGGYTETAASPKKVFLRSQHEKARPLLCQVHLERALQN